MTPKIVKEQELSFLDLTKFEFFALGDAKAIELLKAATLDRQQKARYRFWGLTCATICYLASLAGCIYLAVHGFEKLAAVVLGPSVLMIVKKMLDGKI
jgi:hypothetical protein